MNAEKGKLVRIAKALSDKTRLTILHEIAVRGSITCGEAVRIARLSQPTVSHHIKILADAGLLVVRKNGRSISISVNRKTIDRFSLVLSETI